MGHNIEYYEYPESVDKNKVYSELGLSGCAVPSAKHQRIRAREKRENQVQSAQLSIGGVVLYSAFSECKSRLYRLQRLRFSNF